MSTIKYSSRSYNIFIEKSDGVVWAYIWVKHIKKHRLHKWHRQNKKLLSFSREKHKWFEPSHVTITDDWMNEADYNDCLSRLQYSRCAKRWFKKMLAPYREKLIQPNKASNVERL